MSCRTDPSGSVGRVLVLHLGHDDGSRVRRHGVARDLGRSPPARARVVRPSRSSAMAMMADEPAGRLSPMALRSSSLNPLSLTLPQIAPAPPPTIAEPDDAGWEDQADDAARDGAALGPLLAAGVGGLLELHLVICWCARSRRRRSDRSRRRAPPTGSPSAKRRPPFSVPKAATKISTVAAAHRCLLSFEDRLRGQRTASQLRRRNQIATFWIGAGIAPIDLNM